MVNLKIFHNRNQVLTILCLGAHSDDIEIGCGGSVLRILSEYQKVRVCWVVLGSSGKRDGEAHKSASRFLSNAQSKDIIIKDYKDSYFPYEGEKIKEYFEELKSIVSPDLIFTHYRNDLHQDHRLVNQLTWNTFRNHFILEYEVIKYDGDLGAPNFFIQLNEKICEEKIDIIIENFKSQSNKYWFDRNTFLSMLRIRGIEARSTEKYAEGFYCRKAKI